MIASVCACIRVFCDSGKGNKQVLSNNDEIGLAMKKNKGK